MLEFCFIGDMVQLALKKEGCDMGGFGKDFRLEISRFISITCVSKDVRMLNKFGAGV